MVVNKRREYQLAVITDAMRAAVAEQLPEYMRPQHYVWVEQLPLTANGKLDRGQVQHLAHKAQAERPEDDADLTGINPGANQSQRQPANEKEALMAKVWQQVLGRDDIGMDDDFFDSGGDSILGLQIIARAKKAGLKLSPRALFSQPTIARLAAAAEILEPSTSRSATAAVLNGPEGEARGPVPLTPIQQWFFAADHPSPHHWNQAMIFQVTQPLKASLLQQALLALVAHHDALRMHFLPGSDGQLPWQQHYMSCEQINPQALYQQIDGEQLGLDQHASNGQIMAAIEQHAAALQRSLDLQRGPVFRLIHFVLDGLDQHYDRILLLAHHLVVDGVSWRILLHDLYQLYQQALVQQPLDLGPKTNSFQQWSQHLQTYAASPALSQELAYWRRQLAPSLPLTPMPALRAQLQANQVASQKRFSLALSAEQTCALLQEAPAAYATQINDLLLAALSQTLGQPGQVLMVELEGHGRESLAVADLGQGKQQVLDLSQTVGWFTSRFPLGLSYRGDTISEQIQNTKQCLRQLPNKGIGYGLLRYCHPDPAIREAFSQQPTPWLSFNYLGQFDNSLDPASDGLFLPSDDNIGLTRAPDSQRQHLVDVIAAVHQGCLQITWQYSDALLSPQWIATHLETYRQNLLALIEHCLQQAARRPAPANSHNMSEQLQCLRPAEGENPGLPLFCLHHRGGHTLEYRGIAAAVDKRIPVYGIQSQALSDPSYQEQDIQVVAADYVALIRQQQPQGPYRLLGWSLGGVLAMAMAHLLEEQGQTVSFIGLIDAVKREHSDRPEALGAGDSLLENILFVFGAQGLERYQQLAPNLRQGFEQTLEGINPEQALDFICDWMLEQQLVDNTLFDRDYLHLRYRTTLQSRRLIDGFKPKTIQAQPYVWWAEDSLVDRRGQQPPTAWTKYCQQLAGSAVFKGGHFDIIQDPQLHQTIADLLAE